MLFFFAIGLDGNTRPTHFLTLSSRISIDCNGEFCEYGETRLASEKLNWGEQISQRRGWMYRRKEKDLPARAFPPPLHAEGALMYLTRVHYANNICVGDNKYDLYICIVCCVYGYAAICPRRASFSLNLLRTIQYMDEKFFCFEGGLSS
jgi:hypothetical protein